MDLDALGELKVIHITIRFMEAKETRDNSIGKSFKLKD